MAFLLVAFVRPKPVVDVEDIVVIFVVIAVVVCGFARLCQHAAGVERRFVLELWVAYALRVHDVRRELAKRLRNNQCHAKSQFGMSFFTDRGVPDASTRRLPVRVCTCGLSSRASRTGRNPDGRRLAGGSTAMASW